MYQTRPSFGSTARSMIRPEVSAGPISRRVRPVKVFSPYLSFESGASAFFAGCAMTETARDRKTARMQVRRLAIDDLSLVWRCEGRGNPNRRKLAAERPEALAAVTTRKQARRPLRTPRLETAERRELLDELRCNRGSVHLWED